MPKSPILAFYLDSFKAAAGEGAVLELKLRLLAGKVPTLRKYAHQQNLGNIEDELATHFGDALSVAAGTLPEALLLIEAGSTAGAGERIMCVRGLTGSADFINGLLCSMGFEDQIAPDPPEALWTGLRRCR